jgi:pimeloyl-ACP methyl ester carboxylesterase
MAIFVLVHGAWGGGWEWATVARYLRDAGHIAYTPTLTGLGERSHLGTPETSLDTHIQDVVNVLAFEDLHDVILSGHSYGGMVVTGVVDRAPERLKHVVYVDAMIPRDGQSVFDGGGPEYAGWAVEMAAEHGGGWRIPPLDFVHDEPVGSWAKGRYVAQPIETMRQGIRLTTDAPDTVPRTFISCTESDVSDMIGPFAARARSGRGWRYRELPTIHDAQMTMPRELADLLLEALDD